MSGKILVTGGAGFIGLATVKELVNHHYSVVVLDSLEEQVHGGAPTTPQCLERLVADGSVEFINGRVEDDTILRRVLPSCRAVVHLAAIVGVGQSTYEARRYAERNALGGATLLEQIVRHGRGIERVVAASSISNYGEGTGFNPRTKNIVVPVRRREDLLDGRWEPVDPADGLPVAWRPTPESHPITPKSVYGLTKAFTEDAMRLLSETTQTPVVCLRYGNVFGGGQALSNPYTGALCTFYARLQAGHAPLLFEDGEQRRRYTHVSDIARANRCAIEADIHSYLCANVSSAQDLTLNEVCHAMAKAMGVARPPQLLGVARTGDVRHICPDATRAANSLDFKATRSFSDGLSEFLAHARSQTVTDNSLLALRQLRGHSLLLGRLPPDVEQWIDNAPH